MIKTNIFKKIVAKLRHGVVFLLSLLLWGLSPIALGAEQVTYYHLDALGSPIAATDQLGNVVWKEAYRPFGDRIRQEDNNTNTVWFTGKPYESGMGLSYFGARWYDPTIGRFMAIDPAEVNPNNLHSFNRYAYANNNPYKYVDPDGNSPIDVVFLIGDGIKLAAAINSGVGIQGAAADFAASLVGVVSPIPGTGQLIKAGKVASKLSKVAKNVGKPDFIVSPKGTTMPTNKDFNLVDSNKKGGDWFQIHNKHTDAKVDGSPHTHYPKQHGGSRTREIKRTDGGDLDRADSALRNGSMRERRNRGDKGG